MAQTIAIANQKGGTGKSTTAFNLGGALVEQGHRVLLVDLDNQQSLARSIHVDPPRPGLGEALIGDADSRDVLIEGEGEGYGFLGGAHMAAAERALQNEPGAELALRQALKPIARRYNFVIIDTPPSLSTLTVAGLVAADAVLVPLQPEYLALVQLGEFSELVAKVRTSGLNKRLSIRWLLPTMFDSRVLHHSEALEAAREKAKEIGAKVLQPIPRSIRLAECPVAGKPITEYQPRSRAAEAYRALSKEVAR